MVQVSRSTIQWWNSRSNWPKISGFQAPPDLAQGVFTPREDRTRMISITNHTSSWCRCAKLVDRRHGKDTSCSSWTRQRGHCIPNLILRWSSLSNKQLSMLASQLKGLRNFEVALILSFKISGTGNLDARLCFIKILAFPHRAWRFNPHFIIELGTVGPTLRQIFQKNARLDQLSLP